MKTKTPAKRQIAFILSTDLIQRIKDEAHRTDAWEAHIVEEKLREAFGLAPLASPQASTA